LWSGAKTLGKETLRTGGKILTDIADKAPGASTHDIVSRNLSESTQKLVKKLRGGGRRKRKIVRGRIPKPKIIKRDIFS
jgi:hypothetical protein